MISCPTCGESHEDGARFCSECGSPLAAPTCASCGASLKPGAKFCSECGAPQAASARPGTPRATGPAGPPEQPVAARRVTSVLFGDLVGFTSLSESRDQEEVRELLGRYFEECRQVIGRYGGTVEKFIGDAVMAVWGVPTAHEDDAERAVRAGLELVNGVAALGEQIGVPDLGMRVGIVTGEVAVTIGAQQQGMVAGDAVNTASRVQSIAESGQVWVDESTRLLTSSAITYVDAGSHQLKGKSEPVPLWSVRAVVAGIGGLQRADGLEATLVGRERELRLVKEVFHAAEENHRPALAVVSGEAGVGKSRLAWEFEKYVDGLSRTTRWHSGRCLAYGEGVAFYALAEAVRGRLSAVAPDGQDEDTDPDRLLDHGLDRYVEDAEERDWLRPRMRALLGTSSVSGFEREDLFASWVTFLQRVGEDEAPVALVIDDAQHADEGLLEFVEYLLTVGSFPCIVLLVTRPELLERRPSLATNTRATVLHLDTLSETEMARLVDGLISGLPEQVRERLVKRAEGVPLFAVETVRSLIDRDLVVPRGGQYVLADADTIDLDAVGAPATLQAVVSARLDALDHAQRRVVDRASVLGGAFRREEIVALCPDVPEIERVLADLVRLQILSRETSRLSAEFGQFQFVQSVVRQVAYSTLSRRDRKRTHLAAVDLLLDEAERAEDVVPIVAQHYLDALTAMPTDPDAAELQDKAIEYLERAARRASGLGSPTEAAGYLRTALEHASGPATVARLHLDLAGALIASGAYQAAEQHAQEAVTRFDGLGDVAQAGRATAAFAETHHGRGDYEACAAIVEARWERLREQADVDDALLELARMRTASRMFSGAEGRDSAEEWLRIAERAKSLEHIALAMNSFAGYYILIGDIPSLGRAVMEAAAELARKAHRPRALTRALNNLNAFTTYHDVDRAVGYGRENVEISRRIGDSAPVSFACANLAQALIEQGAWDEALALLDLAEPDTMLVATFAAQRAMVARARGVAWELGWELGGPPAVDDGSYVGWQRLAEAYQLSGRGQPEAAVSCGLGGLEALVAVSGLKDDFTFLWGEVGEMVVRAGDEPSYRQLIRLAGDGKASVPLAVDGHRRRFEALWQLRQDASDPAAEAGLREAVELFERWGSPVRAAQARADLAGLLGRLGRADEAAVLADAAGTTFEELGAVQWLERLRAQRVDA